MNANKHLYDNVLRSSAETQIAQLIAEATQVQGRNCAAVIQQVLNNKSIFVFAEFLDVPSIAALSQGEFNLAYNTLKLFAYGTYEDYSANRANFLPLAPQQEHKLKQLSVVSLAQNNTAIEYKEMMSRLNISSTRQLEDLIIDAIYAGLIVCKLDPFAGVLHVSDVMSRDVPVESIDDLISTLTTWRQSCDTTLTSLMASSVAIRESREANKLQQDAAQATVNKIKATLKDTGGMGGGGYAMDVEDDADYSAHQQQGMGIGMGMGMGMGMGGGNVELGLGGHHSRSAAAVSTVPMSRSFKRNRGIGGAEDRNA